MNRTSSVWAFLPTRLSPDTPAAKLPGHLPDDVKAERRDRLMQVQQQIAFDWCEQQVGSAMEVIIDKPVDENANVWIGRTFADAPDVDALVFVTGRKKQPLAAGQIVPVEIVGSRDYDLIAAAIGNPR